MSGTEENVAPSASVVMVDGENMGVGVEVSATAPDRILARVGGIPNVAEMLEAALLENMGGEVLEVALVVDMRWC